MTMDHRAIVLALLRGQTYATFQQLLGCSSKTIRAARQVLATHNWPAPDVEALTDTDIARAFPGNRNGRDESSADINIDAVIARMGTFSSQHPKKSSPLRPNTNATSVTVWSRNSRRTRTRSTPRRSMSTFTATTCPGHWTMNPATECSWTGQATKCGSANPEMRTIWVSVFVATLAHSGMVFAEFYPGERARSWIAAHVDACYYFGGVPALFVPDNASTASFRPRANDPAREISTTYP